MTHLSNIVLHPATRELLRFLLVGGTGAVLYVVLSTAALATLALPAQVISIGIHALLIPGMFYAQRAITFRSSGTLASEFAKYALLQIACISASTLLLAQFTTSDWRLNALVFTAIAAASSLLSFMICRFAIFSDARESAPHPTPVAD